MVRSPLDHVRDLSEFSEPGLAQIGVCLFREHCAMASIAPRSSGSCETMCEMCETHGETAWETGDAQIGWRCSSARARAQQVQPSARGARGRRAPTRGEGLCQRVRLCRASGSLFAQPSAEAQRPSVLAYYTSHALKHLRTRRLCSRLTCRRARSSPWLCLPRRRTANSGFDDLRTCKRFVSSALG
jgi:hypothetical protein